MIKRKLKLDRDAEYNKLPKSFNSEIISAGTLASETKQFLDKYFKGCFTSEGRIDYARNVYISKAGFAYILRLIFAEVFARELIRIKCVLRSSVLSFIFEFNPELISEECIERLTKAARLSGFGFEIVESGANLTTNAFIAQTIDLNAGAIKSVYIALEDEFFENIYLQD